MFIKRAKSRPSLRAREVEAEPSGSPLAKSSFSANDHGSEADVSLVESGNGAGNGLVEEDDTGGSVMERKKAQRKEKRIGAGKAQSTRLSFGGEGEDEGTGFKPRKSLLSQSIKLPSTPSAAVPTPSSSATDSTPSYSREYLSELKAATPSRVQRAAVEETDDQNEDTDGTGLSRLARDKYASTFAEDTTAGIPDAAAVASARMKRQAAVESAKHGGSGAEDYISLGEGRLVVHDGTEGPHPESRLMREEDEEGEGDEDLAEYTEAKDRLHIGKQANKDAARRMRGEMGEMIADREAEDEDDEETKEWELAQVRRAGNWEEDAPLKPAKRGYVPAPIPVARPMPTIPPAQARIAKALAEASAAKSEGERALEIAAKDLSLLEEQERDIRKEVERVEAKREWVEEFRIWVEMLGEFLEEKFPKLEEIEADSLGHLKERAGMVDKRRSKDMSDDLALFLGVPASTDGEVEELDEVGRSRRDFEAGPSSGVRRARRAEREARRSRRKPTHSQRPSEDEEGFSTDSTLADADAEDYAHAHHHLEKRVYSLLEDVRAEDFRDPEKGLAIRFGEWRMRYEEEYVNAFGGLSMVQAWEFWARGEMVGWEPLRGSSPLESFRWFTALYAYSRPRPKLPAEGDPEDMDVDEEPPLGPDGDLVAQMVSDAVVPRLTKAFEAGAYDPYSAKQTRRAVDLAEVIVDLAGKDSRKYTALLRAVLAVFHNHILTLSSTVAACSASSAALPPAFDPASRFAMQRFVRKRIKLLRNMLLWRREAGQEVGQLCNRLLGEVIRPALERAWDGGGREMAEKVLAASGGVLTPDLVHFLQRGPIGR